MASKALKTASQTVMSAFFRCILKTHRFRGHHETIKDSRHATSRADHLIGLISLLQKMVVIVDDGITRHFGSDLSFALFDEGARA